MKMMKHPNRLQPGKINQYSPSGLVGWLGGRGFERLQGADSTGAIAAQLKRGVVDPDALPWVEIELARATATAPPAELRWENAPDVCPITTKLIRAATRGWMPTTPWLHHVGVRTAVHTALLVGEGLHKQTHLSVRRRGLSVRRRGRSAIANATGVALPLLPPEMWVAVLSFFMRRGWSAEGCWRCVEYMYHVLFLSLFHTSSTVEL
jgi:hypothetical protein